MEEGVTLSIVKMFRKSWKLLCRSRKQMLPILLIFPLPYSVLLDTFCLYFIHLVQNMKVKPPTQMTPRVMQSGLFENVLDRYKTLAIVEVATLLSSILLSPSLTWRLFTQSRWL